MNVEIAKPSKRERAKTRAISRLVKAMNYSDLAWVDCSNLPPNAEAIVSKARDAIRSAIASLHKI